MENKSNLAKAIIQVMKAVKGIEKSMTVGSGNMSYKGVPDQEVKKTIGEAMEKAGLCILPIGVETKTQVDRWEEASQYGVKQKQSVFTEASTKYLLLHESGESQEIAGYGHGVDSQDKGAGKATTYALKYTLLYLFLVPTGKIDDSDAFHSDEQPTPQPDAKKAEVKMNLTDAEKPYYTATNDFELVSKLIEDATDPTLLKTFYNANRPFFLSNPEMGTKLSNKGVALKSKQTLEKLNQSQNK